MVTISRIVSEMSGVQVVISQIDHTTHRMPTPIASRGSMRAATRPASTMATIVPMPRGAMISPAVSTG